MNMTLKQGYSPLLPYIVAFGDFLVLNSAFILFFVFYDHSTISQIIDQYTRVLVCWNASYFLARVQTSHDAYKRFGHPGRLVRNLVGHFVAFIVLFLGLAVLLTNQIEQLVIPMMILFPILLLVIIVIRSTARKLLILYRKNGRNTRNFILVGNTYSIKQLFDLAYNNPYAGLHAVGYFAPTPMPDAPGELKYLGDSSSAITWLENTKIHIHRVYCQVGERYQPIEQALLDFCEAHVIKFYVIPCVSRFLHRSLKFETFNEVPILSIRSEPLTDELNKFMKRCFDLLGAIFALCFLFPIAFVFVGIGAICNRRSIFLRQTRTGLNKKPFTCYTFRSYHMDNTYHIEPGHLPYEYRKRNKWERFLHRTHIDVIPQFWNVLKGNMSIIGPRPHLIDNAEQYSQMIDHYLIRNYVKPGVTGWSQLHGFHEEVHSLVDIEKLVQHDVWYIENWGLFLDLRILSMTIALLIKNKTLGKKLVQKD